MFDNFLRFGLKKNGLSGRDRLKRNFPNDEPGRGLEIKTLLLTGARRGWTAGTQNGWKSNLCEIGENRPKSIRWRPAEKTKQSGTCLKIPREA